MCSYDFSYNQSNISGLLRNTVMKIMCVYITLRVMQGLGISTFSPKQKQYPLVNGVDAARDASSKENAK